MSGLLSESRMKWNPGAERGESKTGSRHVFSSVTPERSVKCAPARNNHHEGGIDQ